MFNGFYSPATELIKAIWAPGFFMCAVASYVLKVCGPQAPRPLARQMTPRSRTAT